MTMSNSVMPPRSSGLSRSFVAFAADIKLAHSIFALPFAAAVIPMAVRQWPSIVELLLLLVAMVSARSFAMGMNRYLDRDVDETNPRTQTRAIPSGKLSPGSSLAWSLSFAAIFIAASFALSSLAGILSVPVLFLLAAYSRMKRHSWLCHWYLGACLGMAPIAVVIALTGTAPMSVILLGAGIAFWTAGFDILYSLQDAGFDREQQLHSVPARFTARQALWLSRLSFVGAVACFWLVGALLGMGSIYQVAVVLIAGVLLAEHVLVRDAAVTGTSPYLNAAFFQANGLIAVVYFLAVCLDRWVAL